MATGQEMWDEIEREERADGHVEGETLADRVQRPPAGNDNRDRGNPPLSAEQVLDRPADKMPDQMELLQSMQKTMEALQKGQRDLNGKFGRTSERLGTMEAQIAAAREAAAQAPIHNAQQVASGDAPTTQQVAAATQTPEEWERLKEDFPDWAKGVEKYLEARMASVKAQTPDVDKAIETALQAKLPKLREDMQADKNQEEVDRVHALEVAKLDDAHPDWRAQKQLPAYVAWLHQQPEDIRDLAKSPRGEDAVKFFDLYKAAVGIAAPQPSAKTADQIQQERQQRLVAASRPTANQGSQQRTGLTLDDLSEREYWALLDKEDREKRSRRS